MRIAAVVGSLRTASINRAVYEAAAELRPWLFEVPIADVPLFNGDIEDAGDPASVAELKSTVADADGLIIFTPEYNGSVPGVTKNVIDWLSRPHGDGVIQKAAVGLVTVAPGGRAGLGARDHLDAVLRRLCPAYFGESLGIGNWFDVSTDNVLTDSGTLDELGGWLDRFADHVAGA